MAAVADDPASRQISIWDRLKVARRVLEFGPHDRQSKCTWCRITPPGTPVIVARDDAGRASFRGVLKCEHFTCPVCGVRRARLVRDELGAAFKAHFDQGGPAADAWMLTLEVPHYLDDRAEDVVRILYDACQAFFRSRCWRRFRKKWDVVGVARFLDVSFKRWRTSGAHPHFHIAILPRNSVCNSIDVVAAEMVEEERERKRKKLSPPPFDEAAVRARLDWRSIGLQRPLRGTPKKYREGFLRELAGGLMPAWESSVLAAGGRPRDLAAFRRHALQLTPGERAERYFTAWSLVDETAATPTKRTSHLWLLDEAHRGDRDAAQMFGAWRSAVNGRQWATGMADLLERLGVDEDAVEEYKADRELARMKQAALDGQPIKKLKPFEVEIPSYLWCEALRVGLGAVAGVVERAPSAGAARVAVLELLLSSSTTRRPPATRSHAPGRGS